jgi:uncharacterized protein DUF5995
MFPYDAAIIAAVQNPPQSIADVLHTMQTIDATCVDTDGLKWFNWLYLAVTQAVENKVAVGGFNDPAWLTELDVQFARLYFAALSGGLTGGGCPDCWKVMLSVRDQVKIARIQFAMAGMNAHINHDLPMAIVSTCQVTNTVPQHGTPQYNDYTGLNPTLDALIDQAKKTLNVRLPGDPLPAISHLEDMIATWDLATFREKAWDTAQNLWRESAAEIGVRMDLRDVLIAGLSKTLLIPVP